MKKFSLFIAIVACILASCEPDPEKPSVVTSDVTEITETTALGGGEVTEDGGAEVTAKGVCWSTSKNPTTENDKTNDGSGVGSFTSNLSDLASQTTYYVRAYATNNVGTSYGEEISFTTLETTDDDDDNDGDGNDDAELPNVKIIKIRDVTENSAVCEIELQSDGGSSIIEKGVCYSKDSTPTISDNVIKNEGEENIFVINITDLEDGVKYHVRAYAINEKGISYGMVRNFITIRIPEMPSVATHSVSDITTINALCEGEILDVGGSNFIAKGFCWSTSENPTTDDDCLVITNPNPKRYKETISDLEENTTYYLRSFITTDFGTSYGEELIFKTPDLEYKNGYITVDGVENYKMIYVEPGTFLRGYQNYDPEGPHYYESIYTDERPLHYVTLTVPYNIGETEVTQDLWYLVMGNKIVFWNEGERKPVDRVSWGLAMDFIKRLNKMTGVKFRLPTEAEWEFAAIGGNESKGYTYSGSDNPDDVAWYNLEGIPDDAVSVVKKKMPNELGIYDMHGNVWEYCSDNYNYYSVFVDEEYQTIVDPKGADTDSHGKVKRGGRALDSNPRYFLKRYSTGPGYENFIGVEFYNGFRLAL